MKQKKKTGIILTLIAGALGLAALIAYTQVMYTLPAVFVILIVMAAVACASFFMDNRILNALAPVAVAVLAANAVIWAVNPMVNQIGYVISGLDDITTILALLISAGLALVAMIMGMVSSFMAQKE
ncbi:MAG: hypothetical protein K6A69_07720 [Lachnospiraceae bacterium]|nr:hypothetical protein [Lachnospiraceae bacterium]